jgi:SAM-dependent methyltransferase
MTARTALATVGSAEMDWERLWAPYDGPTYEEVLAYIQPNDIVLEIGAGDLRLAQRLAQIARRVYAIEIDPTILQPMHAWRDNLHVVCADAYQIAFPPGLTVGVLLMRHCQQFSLLVAKFLDAGCRRLITNARWRLGVELIDLYAPRIPFPSGLMGWYACLCGATGFLPGPPEYLTRDLEAIIHQVSGCPACALVEA